MLVVRLGYEREMDGRANVLQAILGSGVYGETDWLRCEVNGATVTIIKERMSR